MTLKQYEIDTLQSLANNNMNVTNVAKEMFYSRKTIYDRLRNIENRSGENPLEFWGLKRLVDSYGIKERNNDG